MDTVTCGHPLSATIGPAEQPADMLPCPNQPHEVFTRSSPRSPKATTHSLSLPTEGWPGWVYLGNWLHIEMVTHPQTVTIQALKHKLHYFDLLWICCARSCATSPQQIHNKSKVVQEIHSILTCCRTCDQHNKRVLTHRCICCVDHKLLYNKLTMNQSSGVYA